LNRRDLQELSRLRLKEAKALLAGQFYDGAYYLAGYSIELALKACIAKGIKRHDFPDKKLIVEAHTHAIVRLVQMAGLEADLQIRLKNETFQGNWNVVKDWSENSRYKRNSKPKQ
jgi:HEPN domain-containing protein